MPPALSGRHLDFAGGFREGPGKEDGAAAGEDELAAVDFERHG